MQVTKRRLEVSTQKNWIGGVFLVLVWLLIMSMIRDFWQTKKGFVRIKETEARLVAVRKENEELVRKMSLVSSEEFKERLIREKLNMRLSDEVVVVMPKIVLEAKSEPETHKELKNWEKWARVVGF